MFIHTYMSSNDVLIEEPHWYIAAFKQPTKINEGEEIKQWCYQTFGPPGHNYLTFQTRWKDNIRHGEVSFSRREDLEWFLLRWS